MKLNHRVELFAYYFRIFNLCCVESFEATKGSQTTPEAFELNVRIPLALTELFELFN